MTSLSRPERERHHELVRKLVSARVDQREIKNGFVLTIGDAMPPAEVAEWVSLEVRCCPFVTFDLRLLPEEPATVTLSGPEGVKPFLDAELGLS